MAAPHQEQPGEQQGNRDQAGVTAMANTIAGFFEAGLGPLRAIPPIIRRLPEGLFVRRAQALRWSVTDEDGAKRAAEGRDGPAPWAAGLAARSGRPDHVGAPAILADT